MTDKRLLESLDKVVDSTIKTDENDKTQEIFKEYVIRKTRAILEKDNSSKIKLKGDDVYIEGKKVGSIKNEEDKIKYFPESDDDEKEFDDIDAMYSWMGKEFKLEEGTIPSRVDKAVTKQSKRSSDRKSRMTSKPKTKDGTPGDYKAGSLEDYHDAIKGKSGEKAYDGETDKRLKKGYYDSTDPRSKHKDAIKGKSDETAFDHGEDSRLKDGYYDKHDPRSAQKDDHKG